MKNLFTYLSALFIMTIMAIPQLVNAQAPEKMSYQAVVRNASNALVTNTGVGMKVSILQGSAVGAELYKELYNPNPMTNANGLVSLEIGTGLPLTGTFNAIDWSAGPHFIKIETDPAGGTNYTAVSTSQLMSVPFALYANKSGSTTKFSALNTLPGCSSPVNTVTTSFQKITDLGTYIKADADSILELDYQTNFKVTLTGVGGVIYQLRVDNLPPSVGKAALMIRADQSNKSIPGRIYGVFGNLPAGLHTISIWVMSINGTGTDATVDQGCFNSFATNTIIIKEVK